MKIKSNFDLRAANLGWADLPMANLRGAKLRDADLRGACLQGANIQGVNLQMADFEGADLRDTILDPVNEANQDISRFETITDRNGSEWCVGYRTANSLHVGRTEYKVGEEYKAPYFSTSDDECHPGLYVWPSYKMSMNYSNSACIKVIFRPHDCHRAGYKWRVREFIVVEKIEGETR